MCLAQSASSRWQDMHSYTLLCWNNVVHLFLLWWNVLFLLNCSSLWARWPPDRDRTAVQHVNKSICVQSYPPGLFSKFSSLQWTPTSSCVRPNSRQTQHALLLLLFMIILMLLSRPVPFQASNIWATQEKFGVAITDNIHSIVNITSCKQRRNKEDYLIISQQFCLIS